MTTAYTQTQILGAYKHAKDTGATPEGLKALAAQHGVTDQQFALAEWGYTQLPASPTKVYTPGPAVAPAPAAPKPATTPSYTQDQINGAYKYEAANGANDDQLWALAQKHGVSLDQFNLANLAYRGNPVSNATWGGGQTYSGRPNTGVNLSDMQQQTKWEVKPNETVRSQLQQVIADDSPLMQQARTRALQSANSRGLLNSNMAMTAADAAMYDAAMPIATQDASTYARAGEFNANTANTFARENNDFTRNAYMADFNVKANDWAAQQEFDRQYQMLDRQQQLTMDREAIQNGYQSARDQALNSYQAGRDDKDAALRLQIAQMDIDARAASDAARLQTQNTMQTQADTVANLNALRTEYADKVFRINTSELSPEKADKAVMDLAATYNPMITSAAAKLGYDPASWIIKIDIPETAVVNPSAPAPASSVAPSPAPAATQMPNVDYTGAGA